MNRWLLVSILVLSCGMSVADEAAYEAECNAIAPRQANEVKASIAEIAVDESRSTSDDLAFMSGLYNEIDRSIGGITSADPLVHYQIDPNLALLPDRKGVCARPAIRLTIGYSSMNVFMDREIPRGSCLYNAIFAHEMHHVAIYKDYISHHIGQIRNDLDDKFNGKTYFFESLFKAKQYVEILGQVFTQHVREKYLGEVNAEQTALDTQAEYSRMQLECLPAGHPM
jgi:hypothetical protein